MLDRFLTVVIAACLAGLLAACQVASQSYVDAQAAASAGDLRKAYQLYGAALQELPQTDPQYAEARRQRAEVAQQLVALAVENAGADFGGDTDAATASQLDAAVARLRADLAYDDDAGTLAGLIAEYQALADAKIEELRQLVASAEDAIAAGDLGAAQASIAALEAADPGQPAIGELRDRWISERLRQAVVSAGQAETRLELEAAMALREELATDYAGRPELADMDKAIDASVVRFVDAELTQAAGDKAFFDSYVELRDLAGLDTEGLLYKQFQELAQQHYVIEAQQWEAVGNFGRAFLEMYKAMQISGRRPEIVEQILPLQDNIDRKLHRTVAVYQFASPSSDPDIGGQVASELLSELATELGYGFRVIDRSKQLFQEALVENDREQGFGVLVADYQVAGTISELTIEEDRDAYSDTVKVKVGEERQESQLYRDWYSAKLDAEAKGREFLAPPPDRFIITDQYESRRYAKGEVAIYGSARGSARIIDRSTTEVLVSRDFDADFQASDQFQEPVSEAGLERDPEELPSRIEVRRTLSDKLVDDISQLVIDRFDRREGDFLDEAQQLFSRREFGRAHEALAQGILFCDRTDRFGSRQDCDDLFSLLLVETEGEDKNFGAS